MRVPEGWSVMNLDRAGVKVIDGDRGKEYPSADDFSECGFCLFLSAKNVTKNGFKFNELQYISAEKDSKLRKGRVYRGNIVLTTRGSVGHFAFYDDSVEFEHIRINSGMVVLDTNDSKLLPQFFYTLSQSNLIRNQIASAAFGSAQPQLTVDIIKKIKTAIPPLPEQQKIAQILSTWDKAIATCEQLLFNSQQQKKALMQQLLTGKKRLLDEDGVRFSDMWEHNILGKLIKEVKRDKEENPNEIELLTVKLHYKGAVRSGKYPNATERGRPYFKRFENELIIGRQNLHNGGVAIVSKNCDGLIASNAISSFENRKNVNVNFILSIMSTAHFRFLVDNLTGGTGQKEVSVGELLKMHIFAPNYEEQNKIATVLSRADREIKLLQTQLEALKQEKKALMQQLLTGKRRVKILEVGQ